MIKALNKFKALIINRPKEKFYKLCNNTSDLASKPKMEKKEIITGLINDFKNRIYATCLNYVGNHDDANDIFQEICIIIWEKFDSFKQISSIGTWIYRITVNTCLLYIRKQKKMKSHYTNILQELDAEIIVEDIAIIKEQQLEFIYDQINMLEDFDRLLMILHLEGMKYEEIGKITGITVSNVGVRLNRIKSKIKINKTKNEKHQKF